MINRLQSTKIIMKAQVELVIKGSKAVCSSMRGSVHESVQVCAAAHRRERGSERHCVQAHR